MLDHLTEFHKEMNPSLLLNDLVALSVEFNPEDRLVECPHMGCEFTVRGSNPMLNHLRDMHADLNPSLVLQLCFEAPHTYVCSPRCVLTFAFVCQAEVCCGTFGIVCLCVRVCVRAF